VLRGLIAAVRSNELLEGQYRHDQNARDGRGAKIHVCVDSKRRLLNFVITTARCMTVQHPENYWIDHRHRRLSLATKSTTARPRDSPIVMIVSLPTTWSPHFRGSR
jgi:hypothetical protein